MPTRRVAVRKLSRDFDRNVYQDEVKRCILPGKLLLQSVLCWPDDDSLFYRSAGWVLFLNLLVIEIFHTAYVIKNYRDIGDAVDAGATVTTTMEVWIIWRLTRYFNVLGIQILNTSNSSVGAIVITYVFDVFREYFGELEGLVRIYIMFTKRDVINTILVKIWKKFWPLKVVEPVKAKRIRRKAQFAVLLTCIFLISSIISNSQITGAPFIRNRGMVLKSTFPFDWAASYYYEIVYVWHYLSDWYVLFVINAFDFFFIALVTNCSVQLVIMQEIFRFILTEESKRHRTVIFGGRVSSSFVSNREMLLECWKQHTLVMGICNELEEAFNIPILIQFFVSTSAICAAALVLKLDSSQFVKMLMYAAAHLSQLFYYCYAGHELSYESGQLSDSIYECNWHLSYDRDFRKALVLMIQRSQRIQCLTAAGMTELDFASFLKIMRLSFSFYTLLNNLLAKNMDTN